MNKLKLRVIFDCRERIYDQDQVIGHKAVYEKMGNFLNWQEILDFMSAQSLNDVDCEIFDIRPIEEVSE